jgi:putrescine transport system permease protein
VTRLKDRILNAGLGVWTFLVFAFLFVPIVFVVAHSFSSARSFLIWGEFSTEPYKAMWDNAQMREAVINSFKAAIGSTAVSIVLGTLAGIALARRPGKWTVAFMAFVLLILTTPEIVDAIGLQLWFVRLGGIFQEGMWPLWIGQSIFSSAVVTLIVRARMAGLDDSLEQAAADLYATPFNTFRQITLPLVAPAILAGGLLAFTFSLDNVVVTQFVSSADTNTFPVYVFGLTRTVMKPEVGAMASVLIALTLLALVLVAVVLRRSGDDSSKIAATLTGN